MSDFIFIAATVVFFAICALYVKWCDKIIGPDDFKSEASDDVVDVVPNEMVEVSR
jgi:hypothetical protein